MKYYLSVSHFGMIQISEYAAIDMRFGNARTPKYCWIDEEDAVYFFKITE